MSAWTLAPERVRVMRNPTWFMTSVREQGFQWHVYCGCCEPQQGGIDGLFWGTLLGGTNDWQQAANYAAEHARQHGRCESCDQIKPAAAALTQPAADAQVVGGE